MPECPRWRLIEPHYINVPVLPDGTRVEWEHRETARESGRTIRKLYAVPMHLDPKDAADYNHPGEIVVCHDVEGASMVRGDYIFVGDPTPGMEPMNEAAEAITAQCRDRWEHPINSLPTNGDMTSDESAFMQQMMKAFAQAAPAATVPKEQYDELAERLARLEAALAGAKPTDAPATIRRT